MCVIYAAKTKWPSEAELERGSNRNTDGAGIAWLGESDKSKKLVVHWQKGLKDHVEVLKFIEKKKIQLPAMIHFRTVSAGSKCPALCHPFPILEDVPVWEAGYAEQVLFHNGHIHNWEDLALNAGIATDVRFPEGVWSDTRALAWLVYLKGPGILPFVLKGSRVGHFFANSTKVGKKDYNRAEDHFNLYGSWVDGDGFTQSISTGFSNREGVVVVGKVRDLAAEWEEDEDAAAEKVWKKDSKTTTLISSPVQLVAGTNEWSLEECQGIIAEIEKEQKDAELIAN